MSTEIIPWVTADSLIKSFGDQAYHKGCGMVIEALSVATLTGEKSGIDPLRKACLELMNRGYHKKEKV